MSNATRYWLSTRKTHPIKHHLPELGIFLYRRNFHLLAYVNDICFPQIYNIVIDLYTCDINLVIFHRFDIKMKSTEPRNRAIYKGTLEQKKEVWRLWAMDHVVKQIVTQIQPPLAETTIYKWIREFKVLSARELLACYEKDRLPELVIKKWKSYYNDHPEMTNEIDELMKKTLAISNQQTGTNESENAVIKPPSCFEKNEMGLCRNVALRSDCGPCYYLRLGRTQEDIERLVEWTLNLPKRVQQAKESFLAREKKNDTN
ncbi:MAG: hypothetical protein ABR958_07030 [Dehalococcoidales bacterium]